MFFGFMAATVRQSRKGFRVELVAGKKKKNR
jgi:ABC-2 type transport system permease protein